ncbi:MAG TPA: glycosyltransferase, partial [Polyangiaceae bacterium]
MRIALLGTRGVPAAYGGFETLVENVGPRLAERGHRVTVYCRPHMVSGRYVAYRGMELVYLPTLATKHLDTIVHTFVSTLDMAVRHRPDVAIYFIAGNSPMAALSRLLGVPSIIHVDGLNSRRTTWGKYASLYLRWTERNAPRCATATVTDSLDVQRLYREEYGAETYFIP